MIKAAIKELYDNIDKLQPKDNIFAASLIRQYNNKGFLSEKQEPWVYTLVSRAKGTEQVAPQRTEEVGSMAGLIGLFTKAKQHLKSPAIVLQTKGNPVKMYMGKAGKGLGHINVTDGGYFGSNKWYGRVSPDGTWTQGRSYPENDDVRTLLQDMSVNPIATAQAYGNLTGRCCFCNRGLTDDKSTDVGYGPVCADHFGLPWGNKK